MTTQLYTHPIFQQHITAPGHPERPERLVALEKALSVSDFDALVRLEAPRGSEESILLAHPESHMAMVASSIPEEGLNRLDPDTVASPQTFEAVMRAIGAANAAVDAVFAGKTDNAFVASRPPGHHAESETAMGFCFFNHIAIAARYAQQKHSVERVAIVDWDVHHGNGTQDIFWTDKSVLYCSTHQMPLYPGTGALDETGVKNNICNAPLAPETGSSVFREAFTSRILPAIENFQPDLILISAGFDAHKRDPLASINLEEDDFSWATGKLMDLAGKFSSNRLVSILEGGYDLEGLSLSAAAHVSRLMRG
jgi:acetoin utilization deacetylase AcuC-like enzyme